MKASTNINGMFAKNYFSVPSYQRAYSWDTELEPSKPPKQVNMFLSDLEEHCNIKGGNSKYYLGHFLFEKRIDGKYDIVDGQQRATTIVIFVSALLCCLKNINPKNEKLGEYKNKFIKEGRRYKFKTVDYDNAIFKEFILNENEINEASIKTESIKRVICAYNYFKEKLSEKSESDLEKLLKVLDSATCSTYAVKNKSEAIQMFIFQNNRGKKTSNLEIVKAKFMFYINLYGGEDKEILIEDVQEKFKTIYESISHFNDYVINEDEVLLYSLRVYFNSLWESNPLERIDKELKIDKNHNKNDSLEFISKFTNEMSNDFNNMVTFFNNDERESPKIHSLIALNRIGVVMPFILKAYRYRIGMKKTEELCELFENIILRHRIISTRADLNSRLNDAFKAFSVENKSIDSIVDTINELKTSNKKENYWWNYWNNESLKESLEGALDHNIAKFILWKYENYLRNKINSVTGYKNFLRYEDVEKPELEHIAPRVPKEKPSNGYGKYDDKFKEAYLDCLGNYLLISKSHNCSIGNKPFKEKLSSYDGSVLEQQKEIEKFANENKNKDKIWGKMAIRDRRKKIIEFIKETYF